MGRHSLKSQDCDYEERANQEIAKTTRGENTHLRNKCNSLELFNLDNHNVIGALVSIGTRQKWSLIGDSKKYFSVIYQGI